MASRGVQQLMALLHSLAQQLASRLGHLLQLLNQNQASAGLAAVAAFAISVFFAWRFSRLRPGAPRRVRRKEDQPSATRAPASAASAAAAAAAGREGSGPGASTGGISSSSAPGASSRAHSSPLAAAVRQHLGGAQRVTCHVLGVLIQQQTPEDLQAEGAVLIPGAAEVLMEVARQADVYLMARVEDDSSEVAIMSALEAGGVTVPGSPFNSTKLLFCSTDTGIMSFVRQLEPDLHVDSSLAVVDQLKRFVKRELYVQRSARQAGITAANVITTSSLEDYFGIPPMLQ